MVSGSAIAKGGIVAQSNPLLRQTVENQHRISAQISGIRFHLAPKFPMLVNWRVKHYIMDTQAIRDRVELIRSKREVLVKLLEQPDLGMLRIDVNQALEEMDDLLAEFATVFPSEN